MNLIAFALGTVPDVETCRRLYDLGSLSDKDAAKVLYHRRKQETGYSEELRPNQQRLAALSLVREGIAGPELISHTWRDGDEEALLDTLLSGCNGLASLISWGSKQVPALGYRALKYGRRLPLPTHLRDLQAELGQGQEAAMAPLHEVAHLLGLPGTHARCADVWEDMLADRTDKVQADLDLQALHIYLIALRRAQIMQSRPAAQIGEACVALRAHLSARQEPHLVQFLDHWSAS